MTRCVDAFLSRLGVTSSVLDTWGETVSFLKSLGFDLMMYGYAGFDHGCPGIEAEVTTFSNFPAIYQDRYRRERYCHDDPVVHHCIGSLTPLRVGRDCISQWQDRGRSLTAIQRRIVNEAADCGMKVGLVVPLRSPGRYPLAGMSLSNAMPVSEFGRFIAECGPLAQLAVLYAHNRLQVQLQAPAPSGASGRILSSRERECLLCVSRGLSTKETARRIGISPRTVDFHIAKALASLGVATRSHAVARAIRLGLLAQ